MSGVIFIRRRKVNTTKLEIIQTASEMFIENGYSSTSLRSIADKLDISPGHLVFYFPTKEHLLAVLIDKLCSFQWKLIKKRRRTEQASVQILPKLNEGKARRTSMQN